MSGWTDGRIRITDYHRVRLPVSRRKLRNRELHSLAAEGRCAAPGLIHYGAAD